MFFRDFVRFLRIDVALPGPICLLMTVSFRLYQIQHVGHGHARLLWPVTSTLWPYGQ